MKNVKELLKIQKRCSKIINKTEMCIENSKIRKERIKINFKIYKANMQLFNQIRFRGKIYDENVEYYKKLGFSVEYYSNMENFHIIGSTTISWKGLSEQEVK